MIIFNRRIQTLLSLALFTGTAAIADVKLKVEKIADNTIYRMENYRVALAINPKQGGGISSYKDKLGGNVELIPQSPRNGLCLDHFQAQPWPGELLDAEYKAEIIKNTPDECSIKLTRSVIGKWKRVEYPKLNGLILEKTITLTKDSPAVKCEVKIIAAGTHSKLFAYWQQNVFFAGGEYDLDHDFSYRPTARGIRAKAGRSFGMTGPENFIKDFSDGWIALIDAKKKTGLAILINYDELKIAYICQGNRTVEPMFRIKYLPPGTSASYVSYIVPVAGLANITAANKDFIAGLKMSSDAKGSGNVTVSIVRSATKIDSISMNVKVRSAQPKGETIEVGELKFPTLDDTPKSATLKFKGAGNDPLVFAFKASASLNNAKTTNRFTFEEYYNGSYKWGENINTDMSTPFYSGKRPLQKVKLLKPAKMILKHIYGDQVWFAEGLLDDFYKITNAVRLVGTYRDKTVRDRAFVIKAGSFGNKLSSFPYDYDKLLEYDFLVFGGVKREALGQIGDEMLVDFLNAGGGMLVLGGPMAYGMSHLKGSMIAKMWPVEISDSTFDMKPLKNGSLKVENKVPFLEDLNWSAKPATAFVHDVKVKPWGKTIISAGGKPFLVIGEIGPKKARIACILAPPMGTVEKGETPFWEWKDWPYLLRQIMWWLEKRDDKFRE